VTRLKKKTVICFSFRKFNLLLFFPQYEKLNVESYVVKEHDDKIKKIADKAKQHHIYISPNVYLENNDKRYDASLWINKQGEVKGISKMVHILQAKQFYEQDYYHPSEEGFKVYDTEFGCIGIVICFDRHLPESIRTCTLMGADLIIIPTANTKSDVNGKLKSIDWGCGQNPGLSLG
jgi:N-carbamoylputrescine amidase